MLTRCNGPAVELSLVSRASYGNRSDRNRMADYIYTMETRLTPEQQRGVSLVQQAAQAQGLNLYLTGGTMRDLITGFAIRDLDFTVEGNALKLQKELERAGIAVQTVDDDLKSLYLLLPGNVRGEITMA